MPDPRRTRERNGIAAPNYAIDTAGFTMKANNMDAGVSSLSKPNNGFPVRKYRVDIFVVGQFAESAKFWVEN